MHKVNAALLVLVVLCAWALVTSQYQSRKLYSELEVSRARARELDVEYQRLQLEQATWGNHGRIEQAATSQLGLFTPSVQELQVLAGEGAAP